MKLEMDMNVFIISLYKYAEVIIIEYIDVKLNMAATYTYDKCTFSF